MKKLSEIPDDVYIYVGDIERLMTKSDYLDSSYFLDKEDIKIYETEEIIQTFSWDDVIEWMEDDQYENWGADVFDEIQKWPELTRAAEIINQIFAQHPTYWEGNEIENDMINQEEN